MVTNKGITLGDASCAFRSFLTLDEANLRTQNDFGFAIVSADDLDLEQNSKKCPSVVELFIQSVVTNNGIALRDASCTFRSFWTLDEANLRTQNDFGFAIVSAEDLDLQQNSKNAFQS